jgi:hypothetical protein
VRIKKVAAPTVPAPTVPANAEPANAEPAPDEVRLASVLDLVREYAEPHWWCGDAEHFLTRAFGVTFAFAYEGCKAVDQWRRFTPREGAPEFVTKNRVAAALAMINREVPGAPGVAEFIRDAERMFDVEAHRGRRWLVTIEVTDVDIEDSHFDPDDQFIEQLTEGVDRNTVAACLADALHEGRFQSLRVTLLSKPGTPVGDDRLADLAENDWPPA